MAQINQAIIFDFDGVLADTLADLLGFSEIVCARLGFPCRPTPHDLEALERMSFHDLGRQLGVPETHLETYVQDCYDLFIHRPEPSPTFPGMVDAVKSCARHARLGIVTGNVTPAVQEFLRRHGMQDCFEAILGVDLPGSRVEKINRMAARLGGLPGSRIFVVGDAVSDIRAAREAGVQSVAVGWGHQSLQKLATLQPDLIAKTPQDLACLLAEKSEPNGDET